MSAEYSVARIRKAAKETFTIEQERMLTAYAERIDADEKAVPVAQGEAGYRFASNEHGRLGLMQACKVASNPSQGATVSHMRWLLAQCAEHLLLATHPHSPDAADSGRVGDVSSRLRGLIAEIDHPKHPAASPDIKLIAGELRAIAALAAQGQGEDGTCAKCGAPTDPDCGHVGECTPAPAASPAGVPDEWHKAVEQVKRLSGIHLKAGTDATDGLFKLAVAHGANETAAAVLAHDANGEINELQSCVFAVARLAMLAAPSATPEGGEVPDNCRQRFRMNGKPYPRSGCAACGKWSPRHRECDAALAAQQPTQRAEGE